MRPPRTQPSASSFRNGHQLGAFSLIELVVIVAIIALLALVLAPSLNNAKKMAQRIDCVGNLKQVGLAFRLWAGDSQDKMPMAETAARGGTIEVANDVWRTFQVLSNELATPKLLFCPSDDRPAAESWSSLANANISYFICLDADETNPEMPLSGDRNLTNSRPPVNHIMTVGTNDVTGWTDALHNDCGNVGLSDGSVQQVSTENFNWQVARGLTNWVGWRQVSTNVPPATLRLALPE